MRFNAPLIFAKGRVDTDIRYSMILVVIDIDAYGIHPVRQKNLTPRA